MWYEACVWWQVCMWKEGVCGGGVGWMGSRWVMGGMVCDSKSSSQCKDNIWSYTCLLY